ncbi:MAG TPA: NAD-dependent epimerase/dehydratase family protein [Alphaproteobacteria bacterium]|nr:NAD-dependent epimerase/dehydratase family protein [Alphaproteobacteria bacterium]
MKYLVTGGAGFIGSHVAETLKKKGHDVVILDNMNDYYDVNLKKYRIREFDKKGIITYFADLSDEKELDKIFDKERFDRVCHLGAQAGVRYSLINPDAYIKSNKIGTHNILECIKKYDIENTVIASSSSVYGDRSSDGKAFTETDDVSNPVSLYAETKRDNEIEAKKYHDLYSLNITCLRFFTVYGPGGRPDMAPWIFTENILANKPIKVFNNGNMQRDYTYIDDITDGVIKALEKPLGFEIINLGNSSPVKLLDMIEIIEHATGKKATKEFMPMQEGDVSRTFADNSKAKDLLGWQAHTSLNTGLVKFVEWYKKYNNLD